MNKNGKCILKIANKKATLPIIIKTADATENDMLILDFASTDVYSLMYPDAKLRTGFYDKLTSPQII